MFRTITVFLPVEPAAAEAVAADPQWWLPAPAAAAAGGWVVSLHAGPATHPVLCRVGAPHRAIDGLWRAISWAPSDARGTTRALDRLLPQFAGDLGLLSAPAPTLVLTGSYDPPGALLGSVADRAGLERVAQATARHFVADVAKGLTALAICERS